MAERGVLLFTCEHAGNRLPARLSRRFAGAAPLLDTHAGYDLGALGLAQALARELQARLFPFPFTRLLVDANRAAENPAVFSRFARALPAAERVRVLRDLHAPHRARIARAIERARGPVVHVAVHSFAGRLRGRLRPTDIGLLYDPAREAEARLVAVWKQSLEELLPGWKIHRNRPYRGWTDGVATWLRTRHRDGDYAGVELEVSQRRLADPRAGARLSRVLARSLSTALSGRSA